MQSKSNAQALCHTWVFFNPANIDPSLFVRAGAAVADLDPTCSALYVSVSVSVSVSQNVGKLQSNQDSGRRTYGAEVVRRGRHALAPRRLRLLLQPPS